MTTKDKHERQGLRWLVLVKNLKIVLILIIESFQYKGWLNKIKLADQKSDKSIKRA